MNELYDRIVANHGKLRNWTERVPGLRDYLDNKDRRKADTLLREFLAGQLDQRLGRLIAIEKRILGQGGLMMMSHTRDAKVKLQTFTDRIRAATPGYSGFFDAIAIDAQDMDRLFAFDEAMIRYLDQIDQALTAVEETLATGDGMEEAVRGVYQVASEASEAFELRDDVLTNLDKQYLSE